MKKPFIFLIFLLSCSSFLEARSRPFQKKNPCNLAIVAIFHNEARFLKEWIEYHQLIGVERFYLFNHESQDNYKTILAPYEESGLVILKDWKDVFSPLPTQLERWNETQSAAYRKACYNAAKEGVKWLAIIDVDEYLVPKEKENLIEFLKDYEKFGGVSVNWQMYGTSNIFMIPENALLIQTLTCKAPKDFPPNQHVKSIVQPKYVTDCINPHYMMYKKNYFQVTENKERFEGAFSPSISVEKIALNHYWARDIKFLLEEKYVRQKQWGEDAENLLERVKNLNEECPSDSPILRFIPLLEKRLLF